MVTELEPGMLWRSQDGPWALMQRLGMQPVGGQVHVLSSCGLVVAAVAIVPGSKRAGTYVLILDAATGRLGWLRWSSSRLARTL